VLAESARLTGQVCVFWGCNPQTPPGGTPPDPGFLPRQGVVTCLDVDVNV